MAFEPRHETVFLTNLDRYTSVYSGNVWYEGRKLVSGSVLFRVINQVTNKTYFEGRPVNGAIMWTRRSSGAPVDITGTFNESTGQFHITFEEKGLLLETGDELCAEYRWTPHYLSKSKVMVEVDGEERWVSIQDLQAALASYLGE